MYSCSSNSSGSRTFSRLRPPRNRARLRLKAAVPSKVYLPMMPLSESCQPEFGATDGDKCQQCNKQVTGLLLDSCMCSRMQTCCLRHCGTHGSDQIANDLFMHLLVHEQMLAIDLSCSCPRSALELSVGQLLDVAADVTSNATQVRLCQKLRR